MRTMKPSSAVVSKDPQGTSTKSMALLTQASTAFSRCYRPSSQRSGSPAAVVAARCWPTAARSCLTSMASLYCGMGSHNMSRQMRWTLCHWWACHCWTDMISTSRLQREDMWSSRLQDKAARAKQSACLHSYLVMRYPASKRVRSNIALQQTASSLRCAAASGSY
jgi:hypothetical protein